MKLWALILAAGTLLAFAAPAADAASARSANTIQRNGLHSTVTFRDPLNGQTAFLNQLDKRPTPATLRLLRSGKLDALVAPVVSPPPPPLLLPGYGASSAALIALLFLH
jgi:hypothetical protein